MNWEEELESIINISKDEIEKRIYDLLETEKKKLKNYKKVKKRLQTLGDSDTDSEY